MTMPGNRRSRGIGMIEVLVAVVVVSLGLLGVATTLLEVTRSTSSSYLKQQAVQHAYGMIDRMRANALEGRLLSGNPYVVAMQAAPAATTSCSTCTPAQLASMDVQQWLSDLKTALPGGRGSVAVAAGVAPNNATIVTVTVQWSDAPAQSNFNGPASTSSSSYTVVSAL
ncbi:MAG: type IV pilus modification protein PilV [Dyella sp.]